MELLFSMKAYGLLENKAGLIGVVCGPAMYQVPVSVEGRELNISWSLLTQSEQRDKDKPAVKMDTPCSGYILLEIVSDQCTVSSSLHIHSSKECQVDWLYKSYKCILVLR